MKYSIYTDGATSGNGYEGAQGGWAWILLDEDNNIIVRAAGHIDNATNNICELTAVIHACAKVDPNEEYIIYSDSAYIINCYKEKWYKKWQTNGWVNSKRQPVANKELWEKLICYFEKPNFHFEKVKGHSTNEYNVIVDDMAVKAKSMKEEYKIWLM